MLWSQRMRNPQFRLSRKVLNIDALRKWHTSSILSHCSLKKKSQVYFFGEPYAGSRTSLIGRNWVNDESSPIWSWYFYIFLRAVGGRLECIWTRVISSLLTFPSWLCRLLWTFWGWEGKEDVRLSAVWRLYPLAVCLILMLYHTCLNAVTTKSHDFRQEVEM